MNEPTSVDDALLKRARRRATTIPPWYGDAPLSSGQERMWLSQRLEPDAGINNCGYAFRLRGPLDADALGRAITEVHRRHDILRTVFVRQGRTTVQRGLAAEPVTLDAVDLRDAADPAVEAHARARAIAAGPYRLDLAPPVRWRLLRLADRDHVLVLGLHHVVADGWSEAVLHRELSALYSAELHAAERTGVRSPLPDLPTRYAAYAAWQRSRSDEGRFDADVRYWADRLTGVDPVLRLPFDRPPGIATGYAGETRVAFVDPATLSGLGALCRSESVTLFAALLTAFAVLLHRACGQETFVVGVPVAGRVRAEVENLIGFFVNTLALPVDLRGDPAFRDVLARVRDTAVDGLDHQDAPLEQVVATCDPPRPAGRPPLVQAFFQLHNVAAEPLRLEGLSVEVNQIFPPASPLDLSLGLESDGDALRGYWRYRTGLFDRATVGRMHLTLLSILRQAVDDPGRRLADFDTPPVHADVAAATLAATSFDQILQGRT